MSWFGTLIDFLRTIDRLTEIDRKHGGMINESTARVAELEASDAGLVTESRAAASSAASTVASMHIAELARRQGALEERAKALEAQRRIADRNQ